MKKLPSIFENISITYKNNDLIAAILLLGFCIAVFYHYFLGSYLHLSYPYNTFLFAPEDRFHDFTNVIKMTKDLNPYYSQLWAVYFPFFYVLVYPFSLLNMGFSLFIFHMLFIFGVAYWNVKSFGRPETLNQIMALFIVTFLTYPFLFSIDRSNFEELIFIFLMITIIAFEKRNLNLSAIFLSFAIATKLFPAVFLILFLAEKKYSHTVLVIALSLIETYFGLIILQGDVSTNISGLMHWLDKYQYDYIIGNGGYAFGHSLFGILKTGIFAVQLFLNVGYKNVLMRQHGNFIAQIYFIMSILGFIYIAIVCWREEKYWKKIALLVIAMNLLPYVSADYKLIYFLLPMGLLIRDENIGENKIYSTIFAFLLIPKAYLWLRGDINISIIVNPLLMLILLFVLIYKKQPLLGQSVLNQ